MILKNVPKKDPMFQKIWRMTSCENYHTIEELYPAPQTETNAFIGVGRN